MFTEISEFGGGTLYKHQQIWAKDREKWERYLYIYINIQTTQTL